jgi:hypothetical protein
MTRRTINLSNKADRIWKWIFPTVLIAIAPVFAQYLTSFFNWGIASYNWQDLIANISPHGELLLVAVALVAESMSDIWRRQICGWQKECIAGLCIAFVLAMSLLFSGLDPTPYNAVAISRLSVDWFIVGLGLCVACKLAGRS